MRVSSRRGLRRVAGGFSLDAGHAHLIVSVRPGASMWSWQPQRDFNGYRTMRLGRLSILHTWR